MIRRLALASAFLLAMLAAGAARAAGACPFDGEQAGARLQAQLATANTCAAAAARLRQCAWGSSADASFAPPVVARCEKDFLARLPRAARLDYGRQMQRCTYRYARNDGTMYISAAALCQVDVAAAFSKDPKAALKPGRASFDCTKASTPLERLICADDGLGQADIILSEDYQGELKRAGASRQALVASERSWLATLPGRCHVEAHPTPAATACVTRAFEARFTAFNDCGSLPDDQSCQPDEDTSQAAAEPRASFDCQSPKTGLEIAICADADLGKADIALSAAYRAALATAGPDGREELVASERRWLGFVQGTCPLGAVGGVPPVLGRACVRSAYEVRTRQLGACAAKPAAARAACLADFKVLPTG